MTLLVLCRNKRDFCGQSGPINKEKSEQAGQGMREKEEDRTSCLDISLGNKRKQIRKERKREKEREGGGGKKKGRKEGK